MDQIIQIILENIRADKLESIRQRLAQLHRTHGDLQSQLEGSSKEINFLSKLNPFSNDPKVSKWRNLNSQVKDIVAIYNSTISQVNDEITFVINNTIALELKCISTNLAHNIEDLKDGVRKLSASTHRDSMFTSIHGKNRLLDVEKKLVETQQDLNALIVKYYGEVYNQRLSREEIIHVVGVRILQSAGLPASL